MIFIIDKLNYYSFYGIIYYTDNYIIKEFFMKNRKTSFVNYCLFSLIAILIFSSCNAPDPEFWTYLGELKITPSSATVGTELTASYSGPEKVSFYWHGGWGGSATGIKYTPTHPGDYYVEISSTGYKNKKSNIVTVTLKNLGGNVTISSADPVPLYTELTANYSGTENVSFQWQKNNVNIPGATGNKYTPVEFGLYNVTISAIDYEEKKSQDVSVPIDLPCPLYYGTWKAGNITVIVAEKTVTIIDQTEIDLKLINIIWGGQSSETSWDFYEDYPIYFSIYGNIDTSSKQEWVENERNNGAASLFLHKTDRQKLRLFYRNTYYVCEKQP